MNISEFLGREGGGGGGGGGGGWKWMIQIA